MKDAQHGAAQNVLPDQAVAESIRQASSIRPSSVGRAPTREKPERKLSLR